MDASTTEFSFLAGQADALGAALPLVRRDEVDLPDQGLVSVLRWGEGRPLATFLHGAGLNAHTWDATILALGDPAVAVDLPGHGDSSWRLDADYRPSRLAGDVVEALEAFTAHAQVLVGQSLGGLTAAAVAARRPDLVSALVVVDILPGLDPTGGAASLRAFFEGPSSWATRDELVDRAIAFGLGGADRADVERGVFLNSRERDDGRIEWSHHFAHLAAHHGDEIARLVDDSGWADLAAVEVPVTLVRATRGFLTDADVARFRERLPAASVVTIDAGHNVQEEQPRLLAEVVGNTAPLRDVG